ncbi:MAG: hypothetical protein Q4E47_00320 [Candidatus Saccharibacteria bacterium]|nr:hypothetical protein [Candidatus Saccharibacteria bacterium]
MEEYQASDDVMMNTSDENRKKKTIIVASIAGLVVLVAAIWGIISIVNSINGKKITVTENEVKIENETAQVEDTNPHGTISPADEYTADDKEDVKTDSPIVADTQETVAPVKETPTTGPADMVATAILAGIAVALVARNAQISKR